MTNGTGGTDHPTTQDYIYIYRLVFSIGPLNTHVVFGITSAKKPALQDK